MTTDLRSTSNRYIKVISGTSGGSIVAGLLAFLDEQELLEKALVREVGVPQCLVSISNSSGMMKLIDVRVCDSTC